MRYLGIDFGLRRVGLAISEGNLASPWQTIKVNGFEDTVKNIIDLLNREKFGKVIIGLPEGKMGSTVLGFVKALRKSGFEVETFDETLSSKKAKQTMVELGIPLGKRRHEDAYSAAQILQDYLDSK